MKIPCVIFEDEHLLVVNKPAGMNTHRPDPFAGEGIYEWLADREARWASLAIIHRLDKETSGVMVFGKSPEANRSLTEQFTKHTIRKRYRLLTDKPLRFKTHTIASTIERNGDRYVSRPLRVGGERAETHFRVIGNEGKYFVVEAEPVTGRTHQIRVQAAAEGSPILGDALYGGSPAARVCLHATELVLRHPTTGDEMKFEAPPNFEADARIALRDAFIDGKETDAYRLIHGAADGWPDWYVDRLGDYILSQSDQPLSTLQRNELRRIIERLHLRAAYHKLLTRHVRQTKTHEATPKLELGESAPDTFVVRENGVNYELSFNEGYSIGLFLDQRDNRRRLLTNHVTENFPVFAESPRGAEVLNTFAYTCAFSVCAAKAGARVTSIDLSRKYLEWGKHNFALNGIDAAAHDFIYGDVFDWLRRLAKKGRSFDMVILDPPTFSQSRESGTFQAEKDYRRLVDAALPLVKSGGVLFASTNAARMEPKIFQATVMSCAADAGHKILKSHYVPQPPDFPVHRDEPAYLKTIWAKVI